MYRTATVCRSHTQIRSKFCGRLNGPLDRYQIDHSKTFRESKIRLIAAAPYPGCLNINLWLDEQPSGPIPDLFITGNFDLDFDRAKLQSGIQIRLNASNLLSYVKLY